MNGSATLLDGEGAVRAPRAKPEAATGSADGGLPRPIGSLLLHRVGCIALTCAVLALADWVAQTSSALSSPAIRSLSLEKALELAASKLPEPDDSEEIQRASLGEAPMLDFGQLIHRSKLGEGKTEERGPVTAEEQVLLALDSIGWEEPPAPGEEIASNREFIGPAEDVASVQHLGPKGVELTALSLAPEWSTVGAPKKLSALGWPDDELRCLALTIYFEARGEPDIGKVAVAHVVMNRVSDERFPDSVCRVVRQGGEETRYRCQFTWWCDGQSDKPSNRPLWETSKALARAVYWGQSDDPTQGALWYHADYVSPSWAEIYRRTSRIGRHIFYQLGDAPPRLAKRPF